MRGFISGILLGGAVAAAGLVGYAHGKDTATAPESLAEIQSPCQVRVGFGRSTLGDSCFGNEVMVGRRGDRILCADLSVTCDNFVISDTWNAQKIPAEGL